MNHNITPKDASILNHIFDPESVPTAVNITFDAPEDPHVRDAEVLQHLKIRERDAIRCLERNIHTGSGVNGSGDGIYGNRQGTTSATSFTRLDSSIFTYVLEQLSDIIAEYPMYASARNNRAQLLRLRYGDHISVVGVPTPTKCKEEEEEEERQEGEEQKEEEKEGEERLGSIAESIFRDLDTAIELLSPEKAGPKTPLSRTQASVLAQAHTQRAAALYVASKDAASYDTRGQKWRTTWTKFHGWSASRFEEAASRDFFLGGVYGNELSRAMAVHTNPHAKLCGAIIQEALKKEYAPG